MKVKDILKVCKYKWIAITHPDASFKYVHIDDLTEEDRELEFTEFTIKRMGNLVLDIQV